MIHVTLTAANMGPLVTEDDFDNWASFVARRIDERTGLDVEVAQFRFSDGADSDRIERATEEEAQIIREAMHRLWDDWCADGAPER